MSYYYTCLTDEEILEPLEGEKPVPHDTVNLEYQSSSITQALSHSAILLSTL
jgi:hypothetical protein